MEPHRIMSAFEKDGATLEGIAIGSQRPARSGVGDVCSTETTKS